MTEVWSLHILTVRDSVGVDHLDEIHVIGGNCLKGSITVQGSKKYSTSDHGCITASEGNLCSERLSAYS